MLTNFMLNEFLFFPRRSYLLTISILILGTESMSAMDDIFNVDPMTRSEPSFDRSSRRRRREEEAR